MPVGEKQSMPLSRVEMEIVVSGDRADKFAEAVATVNEQKRRGRRPDIQIETIAKAGEVYVPPEVDGHKSREVVVARGDRAIRITTAPDRRQQTDLDRVWKQLQPPRPRGRKAPR